MKNSLLLLFILSLALSNTGFAAYTSPPHDSLSNIKIKLVTMNGEIIKGRVNINSPETITVSVYKKRENFSTEYVTINYADIKSIKIRQMNWLSLLISAGLLWVGIKTYDTDEPYKLAIIASMGVVMSIIGLIAKKKYTIDGGKNSFLYFLSRGKKFFSFK